MKRLRIGLDYRPALLGSTGIGRSVRELARALQQIDDGQLHLFGHSLARARRADAIPARLHRQPIPGRSLPLLAKFGCDATRLCGGATVFHWTDYVHPPVRRQTKRVLTIHDVAFAEHPDFHGEAMGRELSQRCADAAHQADAIVTPSAATAFAVEQCLSIPAERIRVVPFGVDHVEPVTGEHPLQGEPFVLSLGTVEPRKNHRRLLDAWLALPATDRPRLVVIGKPGWQSEATIEALREAVEAHQVLWLQTTADDLVYRYLQHAVVLAYPSRLEGFGFPPLEAMRLGTPVLAGDTPALREVLADAAEFCDPEDTASIGDGLARLLGSESRRQELQASGSARSQAFRWQDCATQHWQLYREL